MFWPHVCLEKYLMHHVHEPLWAYNQEHLLVQWHNALFMYSTRLSCVPRKTLLPDTHVRLHQHLSSTTPALTIPASKQACASFGLVVIPCSALATTGPLKSFFCVLGLLGHFGPCGMSLRVKTFTGSVVRYIRSYDKDGPLYQYRCGQYPVQSSTFRG